MSRHKHSFNRPANFSAGPVKRSDLMLRQANEEVRAGRHAAAAALFRQCALLQPANASIFYNLGLCLQKADQTWEAADAFRAAIALKPTAQAHVGLADALRLMKDADGAMRHCDAALSIAPHNADAHVIRGSLLSSSGRLDEAVKAFQEALRFKPAHPDAHLMLGTTLTSIGQVTEAIPRLRQARVLRPNHVPTLIELGVAHHKAAQPGEALEAIRKASELEPQNAVVYTVMTTILSVTSMRDMALSAARLAVDLAPDLWAAAFNLGTILFMMGKEEEAMSAYARAVEIDPLNGEALFKLVELHQRYCDWEGLETARTLALTLMARGDRYVPPFSLLPLTASPIEHLRTARAQAKIYAGAVPLSRCEPRNVPNTGRLRIGYVSADFRKHPVADLVVELFELHDKATIETFGYSIGVDDQSPMRARLIAALDHFKDLRALGDHDAAKLIYDDRIDILVDLSGYTSGCRPKILAWRPAPIQVNYLGYPGSMGAPFIDYIIADRHIAPFEHQAFYDEKIVHLPHSYQPNDRKRTSIRRTETRKSHGLPEAGFVFCCFNNNFKISSDVFDVWMRLLAAVPASVLWLLKNNERVEATLRREATSRGVSGDRLVFAPRVAPANHIARMSLADLFLDTLLYNAHTTASEALWVGVPVVTLIGAAFPARVGASLLRAVNLPDLVTETLADYEAKALSLATNPEALAAVTSRLLANEKAPLFDTPRFTRHLESAYHTMAGRLRDGLEPQSFAVEP